MSRVVQFIVRNWPLKLAAIALATLLYAGLVLSQSAQVWTGSVPIVPLKLPTSAVLLSNLPPVTSIRYFAPAEVAQRLTSASFSATVDLSSAQPQTDNPIVIAKVTVTNADQRVTIIDFDPPSIVVRLDPLVSKTVPISVEHGNVPAGLELRDPVLSAKEATVSGPESVVRLVASAEARVVVQPSGIDVDQTVDLVAVDARGEVQSPVDVQPSSVRVQIAVGSGLQKKTLPVHPVVTGTPAAGFEIDSIAVDPPVVSVEGDADALAILLKVDTGPISVSGASTDLVRTVPLDLLAGVTSISGDSATVTIVLRPVAATRTYSVGIVLSGARDDRTYTLSSASVLITVGGTVAALDSLDPRTLAVVTDVNGLAPGSHKVKLTISLPADVQLVATSPPEVTVTIVANASPTAVPSPAPSGP
ncbi:MAG: CdaR family protein [Chloroflexota bacterium]